MFRGCITACPRYVLEILKSSKDPFSKNSLSPQARAHIHLIPSPALITVAGKTKKRILTCV